MKNVASAMIVLMCLTLSACEKTGTDTGAAKPQPSAASKDQLTTQAPGGHAAPGVVPGSYEDWCEEHQVPETQCTRCNPALIAAFKATRDWCDEHGLPESQCLACNPDLKIVRPARPADATEPKTEG